MKTLLIGLGSKARIGKDFAAKQLSEYFDVERIAFADEIKSDIATLFQVHNLDFNAAHSDADTKELLRPLLVSYGQTMRKFNQDIWIDPALKDKQLTHEVTIVTDVRFPNEVERIHQLGGLYAEISADIPPSNEVESLYSPQMAKLADIHVTNNFDGLFISDLRKIISGLLHK